MIITDVETYEVPTNQALLYSVVNGEVTTYKYKLPTVDGVAETGDVSINVLNALDVKASDLTNNNTVLVYSSDLLAVMSDQSVIDGTTSTLSTNAVLNQVKRLCPTKADLLTRDAEQVKNLTDHTSNTTNHITSAERTSWDAKISKINGSTTDNQFFFNKITFNGTEVSADSTNNGAITLTVPEALPTVTTENNGKVLKVVDGVWSIGDDTGTVVTVTDALDSDSTTNALSAAKGKALDGYIDNHIANKAKDGSDLASDAVAQHVSADEKTAWGSKISAINVLGNLITKTMSGTEVSLEAYKTVGSTEIPLNTLEDYSGQGAGSSMTIGKYSFQGDDEGTGTKHYFEAIIAAQYPENSMIFGSITANDLPDGFNNAEIVIFKLGGNWDCYYAFMMCLNEEDSPSYRGLYFTQVGYSGVLEDSSNFDWKRLAYQSDIPSLSGYATTSAVTSAIDAAKSEINTTINSNTNYTVVTESRAVTINSYGWYIIKGAKFEATLPTLDDDVTTAQIKFSVDNAAASMGGTITPPTGYTINGSSEALALNAKATFSLVLDGTNWIVVE